MSDELNPQEGQTQPTLSPTQEQALASGWVPKEDFKGDPEKWVEAGEFLRRGELFAKIEHQNKKIKDMDAALKMLGQHYQQVSEVEYQRALKDLKEQKKSALEEGDADRVIEVDEMIAQVREAKATASTAPAQPTQEIHPAFTAWQAQNPWYERNGPMRAYADALGTELHASGMHPDEVLRKVSEEVRKEFASKFTNPRAARPAAVEGSSTKSGQSSSSFQLSADERRIMNTLVRQKVLTEEQYVADLKKVKGV